MKLVVYNIDGTETGRTIKLNPEIFEVEPNDHAIYLDVKQYLANNRQGSSKTKERAEVSYSTRKIKRQKGTGGARAGSIKSPVFIGGGKIFGPRPRDYNFKLNKKVKQLARFSALSYKAKEKKIVVIEDFKLEAPKTKEFVAIRNNLKIEDKKLLMVFHEPNKNVYLSSRNLQDNKVVTISELTTYDIINASIILFSEGTINVLQKNS
jgi:large subunit ribosomal protein L4